MPESLQILPRKAATKLRGQVVSQPGQQFFAVARPLRAALLELHDPASNLPIRRRHECIDGAGTGAARGLEQFADATEQTGVVHYGSE